MRRALDASAATPEHKHRSGGSGGGGERYDASGDAGDRHDRDPADQRADRGKTRAADHGERNGGDADERAVGSAAYQQLDPSTRPHAAMCSALSCSSARPSSTTAMTRSSASR